MNPSLSLYLDLLRFLAAFAVLVGHVSSMPFTDQLKWWHLNSYGDAAVIIFFVLSGYVIAYVTHTREKTAREYFSARIARLYSVVGICLALTFALDLVGMHFRPDFYAIQKVLWKPPSLSGYLSSAFFVNEYQAFNFDGISPGSNAPYWSLSFEATYYAIAGIVLFSPLKYSIPATFLILCMAGKTISALFPLWLLGYFLYRAPTRPRSPFISNRFLTTTFIAAGPARSCRPGS
jgi:peptidoglycan/LPS O-acetylase OafA/YrhL